MGKNKEKSKNNNIQVNINNLIQKLLNIDKNAKNVVSLEEAKALCVEVRQIFMAESMLVCIDPPINICGDIHGQYRDLIQIFEEGGYPGNKRYLFLGDYVDRGKSSLECIILLFAYKIKYPNQIYLLRGNHQEANINKVYGFFDQCKRKLSIDAWKWFIDVFNCMPIAALVGDKIFCIHGGLSPQLQNMQQIQKLQRPSDVPDSGLFCDLLWADPSDQVAGWAFNKQRTISYTFGREVVNSFLYKHDLDLICRAHEVVQKGYQFYFQRKLVTLFSASNYTSQFDNQGAFMSVDQNLKCSCTQFQSDQFCKNQNQKKKKK